MTGAAATLGAFARQRAAVGRLIDETRPFEDTASETLPEATDLLTETGAMARRLSPAVRQIADALPDLNGLLERGGDLAQLSRFGHAAQPVMRQGKALVGELLPVGLSVDPFDKPFRPFAQYLDPYRDEMVETMRVFNEWTKFHYSEGKASGSRAVRFGPVFTCHRSRDPYPKPGQALRDGSTLSLPGSC
jgi:hypothetical protein